MTFIRRLVNLLPLPSVRTQRLIAAAVGGIAGNFGQTNYTATKAALIGYSASKAKELKAKGITINAIAPGYFETDATEALRKDRKRFKELSSRIPAGRWGVPDDLKGTVLYLASKASDYVHGQVIVVDGGWMSS